MSSPSPESKDICSAEEHEPRHVSLYTWGSQKRKHRPSQAQKNICVTGISTYKPQGINLKRVIGLNKDLQAVVQQHKRFAGYMDTALRLLREDSKLCSLSVNCQKGRHRSVAFAELLAKRLRALGYEVDVYHLEL